MVPVENYLGSFGDNYCIGCNNPGMTFPTETPYSVMAAGPRTAAHRLARRTGYVAQHQLRGRRLTPGVLRGMFDVTTGQTVKLASVTDGTSNTIAAGEGLPAQRADNNVWEWNSGANGTTVPINYSSAQSCALPGRLGLRPTGPRAVPTRTQASRAITPAAATFCSSMGPSTSSSRRSTCSRTAPSAAATAARSSVPITTDRTRLERAFAHHVIADQAAVGPGSPVRSNRRTIPLPRNKSANANQDHKTHASLKLMAAANRLPRRFLAMLALPALLVMASCGTDDGLGKRYPVSGTVTYNGKPLEKGEISFVSEDLKNNFGASGTDHQRLVHPLNRRQ